MSDKMNVLFVCTGNSCRSQMAEGWTRHLHGNTVNSFSAGIEPRRIDPLAVKVMAESGVDISKQESHAVKDFLQGGRDVVPDLDVVVTVCSESSADRCPTFPKGVKVLHHPFDDPPRLADGMADEEEKLAVYRRVRDEIREFVNGLPDGLA